MQILPPGLEPRFQALLIDPDDLLFLLNAASAAAVRLPVFPDLPDDARFHSCHFLPMYNAWHVVVWSSEYDVVQNGCQVPWVEEPHLRKAQVIDLDKLVATRAAQVFMDSGADAPDEVS